MVVATITEGSFVGVELSRRAVEGYFAEMHDAFARANHSPLAHAVSRWMDKAPEYRMPGGIAHRILHGHSVSDVLTVFREYGFDGTLAWAHHMSADFLSPHGLPFPFAKSIMEGFNVSYHDAVKFLCANSTDILSASLGTLAFVQPLPAEIRAISSFAKICSGVSAGNTCLILSATLCLTVAVSAILTELARTEVNRLIIEGFSNIQIPQPQTLNPRSPVVFRNI
jgi:hypothetical protein